jgi:hypothetical protein
VAAAVVQFQQRHVAARIDREVVVAAFQAMRGEVDLDEIGGDAGLAQRDVDGERAGAGGVIKLHGGSPGWVAWKRTVGLR